MTQHVIFFSLSLSPMPPPVLMNFVVFPPGCGYSVADFWGWVAHEARLRCPDEVSGDMCEDEVPVWALKSKSTNYPDHSHHGDLSLPGKIPMVKPVIEPGTSWLVVRNLDHQTMRLVLLWNIALLFPSAYLSSPTPIQSFPQTVNNYKQCSQALSHFFLGRKW